MKKILITGAGGFIGSHLVEFLIKNNYNVKALVSYNSKSLLGWLERSKFKNNRNLEIVLGDIRDPFFTDKIMSDVDNVLHLAALIAIPYSYVSPGSYIDTNVTGTLNLLNSSLKNNIKKFIHTSTSEVYGSAQYVPIDEKHPLSAQSPYAASKISADQLVLSYQKSFDLNASVIRPFNTYGPRQSLRAVIPTIIAQHMSQVDIINLGSLSPTRDFNYVFDTVNGFKSALLSDKINGEIINLSSNFEISIGETNQIVSDYLNSNKEVIQNKDRLRPENSEVNRLFGSNKKAKNLLNWEPKYGGKDGFIRGIEETIKWFFDNNVTDDSSKYYI